MKGQGGREGLRKGGQCLMKLSFPTRSLRHSSLHFVARVTRRPRDSLFINAIGKTREIYIPMRFTSTHRRRFMGHRRLIPPRVT